MKNTGKYIRTILIAAVAAVGILASGCVPQERSSVRRDPDLTPQTGVDIDFVQVHNGTIDSFGEDNPYVFITDVYIDGTNDPKAVTVTATCLDEATKEDAEHFAAAAVRRIGAEIAVQSGEFDGGDQQSFGNVWDTFSLKLTVQKESAAEGEYLLELDVPAGEEIPLDPDIESYEESWEEQRDMMLENTVY